MPQPTQRKWYRAALFLPPDGQTCWVRTLQPSPHPFAAVFSTTMVAWQTSWDFDSPAQQTVVWLPATQVTEWSPIGPLLSDPYPLRGSDNPLTPAVNWQSPYQYLPQPGQAVTVRLWPGTCPAIPALVSEDGIQFMMVVQNFNDSTTVEMSIPVMSVFSWVTQ
jgi:hypothetical protein